MECEFNEKHLTNQLKNLEYWKQLIFLFLLCNRMYPNFIKFSSENGYSGEDLLSSAMSTAWNSIVYGNVSPVDCKVLAEQCIDIAPDTEDFGTVLGSLALDAVSVISMLLEACSYENAKLIVDAASLMRDTLYAYIDERENLDMQDLDRESKILNHFLMQRELRKQRECMEFLMKLEGNAFDNIRKLQAAIIFFGQPSCV